MMIEMMMRATDKRLTTKGLLRASDSDYVKCILSKVILQSMMTVMMTMLWMMKTMMMMTLYGHLPNKAAVEVR